MPDGEEKGGRGRVTIRTVATDAGVSVAAVSKVMRNAYGVSEALRAKVESSIGKLGYRPSVAARGMRGQTFTLGVLLVGIDNPFLPSVLQGIESVTEVAGFKIMVGVGAARSKTESRLIEQMIDNRMDGLILVAPQAAIEALEQYARQIPIVVIGHHEPTVISFDTINNDDVIGARMAVQALLNNGHRDIAMITMVHPERHQADVGPQRERGYLQAMAEAGHSDKTRFLRLPQASNSREDMMRQFLMAKDRPTAVFCWSDLDAVPMINMAFQLGIKVPGDLSIVGYDNSPVAALPLINLASVDQDGKRQGMLAAQALLSRINGRSVVEHILIEPKLVARGSLSPATVP